MTHKLKAEPASHNPMNYTPKAASPSNDSQCLRSKVCKVYWSKPKFLRSLGGAELSRIVSSGS